MRNQITASVAALLLGLAIAGSPPPTPAQAQISIGIRAGFGPPMLPIYNQPPIPAYGYIWTPGYWAWDDTFNDYYWAPGAWVRPPRIGYLWTPGYWGWSGGRYVFNTGYWARCVGFYGGINYGYGYEGSGYGGAFWQGRRIYYNQSVNNIRSVHIPTIYSRPVTGATAIDRIGYSGGPGGVQARPSAQQRDVLRGTRLGPTPQQLQQRRLAARDRGQRAGVNHGVPPIAATARPGTFNDAGAVPANAPSPARPR